MQISKSKAEEVARKLTQKKYSSITELQKELSGIAQEQYLSSIPKDVVEIYKKHPSFFRTESSVYARVEGIGMYWVSLGTSVPKGDRTTFDMTGPIAEKYVALKNKIDSETEAVKKLKADIESTIIQLRTYKNILATFPEAAELIDNSKPNLPMVPIDKIRDALNS
jgi:hypothetical protein